MKTSSPLAILFSTLLLQGRVTVAVVGTAAVDTKVATNPRTVGTQVGDSALELRVDSALPEDEQIKEQACINIIAYQDKVLSTGQSPASGLSAHAEQIVTGVEGTMEVFDEVRQGQPIGLGTASSDAWIITKARSQLLGTDQVKSSNVKVTMEDSEIFLMGLVTEYEGRAVMNIASRVSSVSRVTTALTHIK